MGLELYNSLPSSDLEIFIYRIVPWALALFFTVPFMYISQRKRIDLAVYPFFFTLFSCLFWQGLALITLGIVWTFTAIFIVGITSICTKTEQ